MKTRSSVASAGSAVSVSSAGASRSSIRSASPARCQARTAIRAHIATQQVAAVGQAASDAQAGIAGEGAHLDRPPGADQPGQHGQQLALIVADLHPGGVAEFGGFGMQLADHLVRFPAAMADRIVAYRIGDQEASHSGSLLRPADIPASY
jgi:hypothetical protein